jgi:predicted GNAT family N-acyltransferase
MVNVVSYTQKAGGMIGLTTLTPLLSKLSAGTEMASYGPQQWNFLLRGGDINAYVVPSSDDNNDNDNDQKDNASLLLLGSLLRVELNPSFTTTTTTTGTSASASASAAFGMMLVSPAARGKGVAKLLLNEAIDDDGTLLDELPIRKLLPVCTSAGQRVYRKLGFSNVGKVTSLSTEINTARNIPFLLEDDDDDDENNNNCINVKTFGSMMDDDDDNTTTCMIDSKIKDLIIQMDSKATGFDRSKRLLFMMKNDPTDIDGVKTIVATATVATANNKDGSNDKDKVIGAAIIRREMKGGPFVIGPLVGSLKAALPLVKALANAAVPNNDDDDDDDDDAKSKIAVLISDHPELVNEFKSIGSFDEGFDFPAMSLDGKSIYENGDGSYLGLIHPTLG